VDAPSALPAAVLALVGMSDLPLVIDTTDPLPWKAALRRIRGAHIVNSVNGGDSSLASVANPGSRRDSAPRSSCSALDDDGIRPRPKPPRGRRAGQGAARAAGLETTTWWSTRS